MDNNEEKPSTSRNGNIRIYPGEVLVKNEGLDDVLKIGQEIKSIPILYIYIDLDVFIDNIYLLPTVNSTVSGHRQFRVTFA